MSKIPVDGGPTQLAFTDEGLWTGNTLDGTLTLVDPEDLEARKAVDVESDPNALAGDGPGLWVAAIAARESHRGGMLRVLSEGGDRFDSIEPAQAFRLQSWQALSLVYDGLVGFRRVAGPLGATVVPDLATSLPVPQDGGRTYSFQLRDGIRYSNGDEVQPADVRASLERQFPREAAYSSFGIPFVGVDRCSRMRERVCDLSDAITVDEGARTVTLHLTEPDPNLLFKLALPFGAVVPAGSSAPDLERAQPLPGTGTYRIARFAHDTRLELERRQATALSRVVEACRSPQAFRIGSSTPFRSRRSGRPRKSNEGRPTSCSRRCLQNASRRSHGACQPVAPVHPHFDELRFPRHALAAVRRRARSPCAELRDGSRGDRAPVGRAGTRAPDLPGASPRSCRATAPTARTRPATSAPAPGPRRIFRGPARSLPKPAPPGRR